MPYDDMPSASEFDDARTMLARLSPSQLAELKASIEEGQAEISRTGGIEFDAEEIMREGRKLLAQRRREASKSDT